jgi:hypothetical protein
VQFGARQPNFIAERNVALPGKCEGVTLAVRGVEC